MGIKNILSAIGKDAFPFIAAAAGAGGPFTAMAAGAVGKALGIGKIAPDPDAISDAIVAAQAKDPETFLKLKAADNDFKEHMAQLGYADVEKLSELDIADRASARSREIAVRDKTPRFLAYAVTFGFFGLLWMLAFRSVPESSKSILDVMVGSLGTAWIGIINYYFGSSSGSAAKTQILADAATGGNVVDFKKAA
jgi:hypothetical protein